MRLDHRRDDLRVGRAGAHGQSAQENKKASHDYLVMEIGAIGSMGRIGDVKVAAGLWAGIP